MDFLNNVMSEDMNPFGDDLLPDFLPDMQGFDHLANLPIVNGDMEMENIHGNIEEKTTTDDLLDPLLREFFDETKILSDLSEIDGIKIESLDLDASFSLPEMVDCVEQEKPKPEDEKPIFPPLAEDAFATIKKLWPDQVEIFKPEKKKRIPKIQKKLKQKCVIARKNMSLVSTGKLGVEKEPVIKPVRREDKSIKRRQVSDEESSDEVDIETVDDESNSKSGSQLLSMKLNGSAARVRAIVPKNRPIIKSLPPIVKAKDETQLNEPIPQFKLGALKIETQAIKVETREENNNGIKVKVEPQVMVNFSQDIVDRETSSPIVEPKVERVDNVVTVSGLEDKQKEVEMSPDTLENLKRRENLMRMLPKGARIKQKSKDSVVEKIRQSTQPQRTSILIPMPENPFVKTKNGKFSVKNHEASGPQTPKKIIQVASGPEPLVKLNSPTITSTNSPPDSFKVLKPNAISPIDTISKIYEQSILKPVMAKVGNGTAAKTKNCLSQPSIVSSSTSGGSSSNQNVEILIKPIVSALTTTVQRKLMNGDKIALMDELQKLLPAIFPSANKSDHNYCSNNVVAANDKSKTISTVNASSVDTYLTATKSESKPVIDSFGVSPVVTIKLDDKNKPNVSCENKLKKYLVNKETGKTISSPWQQDILLEELRSMKRKCKNSAGSLPSKKHRSSCSPSTSSSSQSNYCYSRSPSHSPRTSGTFTNRSRGEKYGNNNRNYRRRRSRSFGRNSSSRSPVYNRKSFSRSRSRSKSPWNRSKKLRKRSAYSRSPSRSRSRSRSWSRSGDSYGRNNFSRNNSRVPVWSENAYKSTREEKNKQIEEKRVIFVGNVPDGTKKKQLYDRFRKFGRIIEISVHFRDDRENYGFVTFSQHSAASDALEHGNENPNLPRFDLRYGCGRQCKKSKYCDFDSQMMTDAPNKAELDFDSLLQSTQAQLYRKRKC